MVSVALATLGDRGITHIRNVLRNNVTDPATRGTDFIFKGWLEETPTDFPYVVMLTDDDSSSIETFRDTDGPRNLRISIIVWADKIQERDSVADDILTVLKNEASADSDGDSLSDNKLKLMAHSKNDDDFFLEERVIRVKEMLLEFQYFGV